MTPTMTVGRVHQGMVRADLAREPVGPARQGRIAADLVLDPTPGGVAADLEARGAPPPGGGGVDPLGPATGLLAYWVRRATLSAWSNIALRAAVMSSGELAVLK